MGMKTSNKSYLRNIINTLGFISIIKSLASVHTGNIGTSPKITPRNNYKV